MSKTPFLVDMDQPELPVNWVWFHPTGSPLSTTVIVDSKESLRSLAVMSRWEERDKSGTSSLEIAVSVTWQRLPRQEEHPGGCSPSSRARYKPTFTVDRL